MNKKVVIVGSGIAGLSAAVRLAVAGHEVDVFEANPYPGGKLAEINMDGYRFDAGPSLFTMPALVDELFELAGEHPADFFTYQKLDINCQYFYPDGLQLTAYSDHQQLAQEISDKTGESQRHIQRAISKSQFLFESLSELFMFSSLQDVGTYFRKKALRAYLRIPWLGFFKTMHGANKQIFKDPRLVQLFDRYATYNGSSPYKTPATMNIIPHLEMSIGAYFPNGGMNAITQAVYKLAIRQGVRFHFNRRVEKIEVKNKKILGVWVNESFIECDRVVSNMDIVNSYRKLLPDVPQPDFLLDQPKSSSALIFYWGISKNFPALDLHNIFFSADYSSEFAHLFEKGSVIDDPTVYVNISSKNQPTDAPANCENWFTMINVPNNQGQDWDQIIQEARSNILNKLSKMLGEEIAPLIVCEEILDPRSIESKTSSALGALYGNSSNNLFAAFLRHANKSKRVSGLYFCGGSVHPGGGIPMALSSAKLVAKYFS